MVLIELKFRFHAVETVLFLLQICCEYVTGCIEETKMCSLKKCTKRLLSLLFIKNYSMCWLLLFKDKNQAIAE